MLAFKGLREELNFKIRSYKNGWAYIKGCATHMFM